MIFENSSPKVNGISRNIRNLTKRPVKCGSRFCYLHGMPKSCFSCLKDLWLVVRRRVARMRRQSRLIISCKKTWLPSHKEETSISKKINKSEVGNFAACIVETNRPGVNCEYSCSSIQSGAGMITCAKFM